MITKNELSKYNWIDISITEPELDNIVLFTLFFDNKKIGQSFVEEVLQKQPFWFAIEIKDGTFVFNLCTNLDTDNICLSLHSNILEKAYNFKKMYLSKKQFVITTGVWIGKSTFDFSGQTMLKIENFVCNF